MTTTIWWIRRDLRLSDNQALWDSLDDSENVVPVYILDPALLTSSNVGAKRLGFLYDGLRELNRSLRQCGSYLVVRRGQPLEQLLKLSQEIKTTQIVAERDISPYATKRDELVGQNLPLKLVEGLTIKPLELVVKTDGSAYVVNTPFSRRWKGLPVPTSNSLIPAPQRIQTPAGITSLPIPDLPKLTESVPFAAGEFEAQRRLNTFLTGESLSTISQYVVNRDRMDLSGTSGLSPYLKFGMLSARQAFLGVQGAFYSSGDGELKRGAEVWLNELIWREFSMSILLHFPHVLKGSFRLVYDQIRWRNSDMQFRAWCEGRTGYPVVDAAMRQLEGKGWMHNRARMITASFLVKDLLIDWRWGEKWFMRHLVDGDPASNNGGWQWVAGTGTDAAPYFRIFNPVLQGKRFDPYGDFVRRWVPEIEEVPNKYIHEPWKMPASLQKESGCVIGHHYPRPIVDHKQAREDTLAAYAQARELHI